MQHSKTTKMDVNVETPENGEIFLQVDGDEAITYEKKYSSLLKRCEVIQQNNERLVNRIHHVKKLLRRLRHERRFLMKRLDNHGDDYKNIPLTLMEEDGLNIITRSQTTSASTPTPTPNTNTNDTSNPILNPVTDLTVENVASSSSTVKKKPRTADKESNSTSKKSQPQQPQTQPTTQQLNIFCQDQRIPIMDQYMEEAKDELEQHELARILGKNWSTLSPDEKKAYYELYEQEKAHQYDQEMKHYIKKCSTNADSSVHSQETSSSEA